MSEPVHCSSAIIGSQGDGSSPPPLADGDVVHTAPVASLSTQLALNEHKSYDLCSGRSALEANAEDHDRLSFTFGAEEDHKPANNDVVIAKLTQSSDQVHLSDGFIFTEPVCRGGCPGADITLPKGSSFDQQSNDVMSALGVLKSTKSGDSVLFADSIQRPTPTAFTGTRHQSYGNLGVSGIAGLSSTSATLAFLPLRASGDPSLKSNVGSNASCIGSPPVVSSPVGTTDEPSAPVASSTSLASTISPPVSAVAPAVIESLNVTTASSTGCRPRSTSAAVSGTAAAIWDRRSSFFSEPPKPISLPTRSVSQFSVSRDGRSTLSGLDDLEPLSAVGTNSDLNATNGLSCTSGAVRSIFDEPNWPLDFTACPSSRMSFSQQSAALTPAIQPFNTEPSFLHLEAPVTYSMQRDVSPARFRDLSVIGATDVFATSTSSSLGCSVKTDSDESGISVWCHSSPQYTAALEPSSHTDSSFFEFGESVESVTDALSALHQTEQFCEAFVQAMPSSSSSFVTPAKVGNIQKLKAFFGETTPRIMEAKTDSKVSSEAQAAAAACGGGGSVSGATGGGVVAAAESSTDAECSDGKKSTMIGDYTGIRPLSATLLEKAAMTAKGKKMATWVLASRHHSSHPQLPSTRPKKSLTDREPSLSPKQKEHRKWKGKVVRTFKRHSSSSAVVTSDPPSQPEEVTGTFGVPLECCYPSIMNELVPLVVEVCTQVVEERGLENQGIYRVPGNSVAINSLVDDLNRDPESACMDNEKWQDVNSVSSLLKLFFRKLPDSLITDELYEFVIAANRTENSERRMLKLKKLLHELPEHNFETFRFLAQHLNKVTSREEINKMDAHNLAIVFGPTLVRPQDNSMVVMVRDMADQCRVVESVILHCDWFFSSWDEDVNVPVDEQAADCVPISGMNQQLLAKAESLAAAAAAAAAAAPTSRDFVSSFFQAANKKIRPRDKSKSADHDVAVDRPGTALNGSTLNRSTPGGICHTQRAVSDDPSLILEIRHYPAYRFDIDNSMPLSTTENSKPSILRRVSLSYESLRNVNVRSHGRRVVTRSGVTLPGTGGYTSTLPRTADPSLLRRLNPGTYTSTLPRTANPSLLYNTNRVTYPYTFQRTDDQPTT